MHAAHVQQNQAARYRTLAAPLATAPLHFNSRVAPMTRKVGIN